MLDLLAFLALLVLVAWELGGWTVLTLLVLVAWLWCGWWSVGER